jgi:hypothetical protein
MKDGGTFGQLVLALVVGFLCGIIFGGNMAEHSYQTDAIEKGYACYNSTNGVWQWK